MPDWLSAIVISSLLLLIIVLALAMVQFHKLACWTRDICNSQQQPQRRGKREVSGFLAYTGFVPWFYDFARPLYDIAERIKSIEILREEGTYSSTQLEAVLLKIRDWAEGQQGDQQAIFERILAAIHRHFRSQACALIYFVPSRNTFEVHSIGIRQARFDVHLKQYLSGFLEHGRDDSVGLRDGHSDGSRLGDFTIFGFRYTLAIPVLKGKDRHSRAVLWLGYDQERAPSEQEIVTANEIAQRIGGELTALSQVAKLSDDVKLAQRLEKEKSDFIAYMSHDIRSPLHNIKAILSLLRTEGDLNNSAEFIDVALRNCDSMGEIVEDLLDYSRFRVGRLGSSPKQFNLSQLITEVVGGFSVSAKIKNLQLRHEITTDDCHVEADLKQIKRIVSNLISNALKYTESGAIVVRVTVGMQNGQNRSIIQVQDTGSGLTPQQAEQLFTAFSRFHHEIEGIGLGLTVAKILAELNKGSISVQTEKGRGSVFELSLPNTQVIANIPDLQKQQSYLTQQSLQSKSLDSRQRTLQILIVDDDPDCTSSLARTIESWGHTTICAQTVIEAIGFCNFAKPDIVLTDATMPNGGGERVLEYLKRNHPNVLVAVLTGNSEELIWTTGLVTFVKPVDLDQLRKWIEQCSVECIGEIRDLQPKIAAR